MISHDHRCVFVHIPKCAGQSVETFFLNLRGLSWEERSALLLRPNEDPEQGPPRLAHLRAEQYVGCGHIAPDLFEEYFKFSFVRNPWDRVVSLYYSLGYQRRCSFRRFVERNLEGEVTGPGRWFAGPQTRFLYTESDKLLVDSVGKYETLSKDFAAVCDALNLPRNPLPHRNARRKRDQLLRILRFQNAGLRAVLQDIAGSRPPDRYRDYYDASTRKLVGDIFAKDVDLLEYQF